MADDIKEAEEDDEELFTESRISKTLTDRMTKIVIILVLTLLFLLPLFQEDTWFNVPIQEDLGLKVLVDVYNSGNWGAYVTAR